MAESQIDRERIAADWAARGFSCDIWVDPPGRCWEDFTHDTDELVMVIAGTMEFEVAGKVQRPAPGEELLIPARTMHSARNVGAVTARWLYGYRRVDAGAVSPADGEDGRRRYVSIRPPTARGAGTDATRAVA